MQDIAERAIRSRFASDIPARLACALVGTGYFQFERGADFGAYTNAERGSLRRCAEVRLTVGTRYRGS